jgi:hypothetical protein
MEREEVKKQRTDPFLTLEIYLASYMKMRGFEPTLIPPTPKSPRVFFSFKRTPEFYRALNDFYSKDTQVSLVDYVLEVKHLRGLMHQARHRAEMEAETVEGETHGDR